MNDREAFDNRRALVEQVEEIERLRESLGEAITTLDLAWNHWNEIGYDSAKIAERVRAILSDSAPTPEVTKNG